MGIHRNETTKIVSNGCTLCEQNIVHEYHTNLPKVKLENGTFQCKVEECEYTTNFETRHSVHLKKKKYACNLCDFKSFDKRNVTSHQDSNHHKQNTQSMKILRIGCSLCDQNIEHENHTNSRKQKSEICKF